MKKEHLVDFEYQYTINMVEYTDGGDKWVEWSTNSHTLPRFSGKTTGISISAVTRDVKLAINGWRKANG